MTERDCDNCGNRKPAYLKCNTKGKCNIHLSDWMPMSETITFPLLNNLQPNIHSCTLKVMEEVGELMRHLGKGQGASGEKPDTNRNRWASSTVCEAIDTAQSAITLAVELCKEYGFDLEELMELHESKLKSKGYLK